jgi:protein-disulfide isomerase
VATGKVKHVFRTYLVHPQAQQASEAALCVAEQSPKAFWQLHDLLFEKTQEWSGLPDGTPKFREYVAQLGLDVDEFAACLESGKMAERVLADTEQGRAMGVGGTPAFFVNDWFISGAREYAVFEQAIEGALRGEPPPPTPTPPPSPFDANPEQPGYTYSGDVTLGSAGAPILLLEFIDFRSSDNRAFVSEQWPRLLSDYVEAGSVRILVKHLPEADQTAAFEAAVAAECAGEQDAFWRMHDWLFQEQETWSQAVDVAQALKAQAVGLGLDVEMYSTCLDQGQKTEKVQQDVSIAQQNELQPAPQFVVFFGDQAGIVPLADLWDTIEQLLQ